MVKRFWQKFNQAFIRNGNGKKNWHLRWRRRFKIIIYSWRIHWRLLQRVQQGWDFGWAQQVVLQQMQRACACQEVNADLQSPPNPRDQSQTLQTFCRPDLAFRKHVLRRGQPETRGQCRLPSGRTWHEPIHSGSWSQRKSQSIYLRLLCSIQSHGGAWIWSLHSLCQESTHGALVRVRWLTCQCNLASSSGGPGPKQSRLQFVLQTSRLACSQHGPGCRFWSSRN